MLLGPPLAQRDRRERMRKLVALPVLSADALSSVAYGPEAMLAVLVLAGSGGLGYSLPIAGAIAFLMLAVGVSYRQTIRAYPHGGGSYIVATDNLGAHARPDRRSRPDDRLHPDRGRVGRRRRRGDHLGDPVAQRRPPSPIGVGAIAMLLAGNLRGVRQAGALFAAPTYAFIIAMFVLIAVGLIDAAGRGFHPAPTPR